MYTMARPMNGCEPIQTYLDAINTDRYFLCESPNDIINGQRTQYSS
jgi:hypothetical protein